MAIKEDTHIEEEKATKELKETAHKLQKLYESLIEDKDNADELSVDKDKVARVKEKIANGEIGITSSNKEKVLEAALKLTTSIMDEELGNKK